MGRNIIHLDLDAFFVAVISLFDDTAENINLYQSIDHIKHKYGVEKLMRANTIDVNKRVRMALNMFAPKSPKGDYTSRTSIKTKSL